MDKNFIEMNISEAIIQLEEIVKKINNDNCSDVEFELNMAHVYGHINAAFNTRHENNVVLDDEGFERIRKMPNDVLL